MVGGEPIPPTTTIGRRNADLTEWLAITIDAALDGAAGRRGPPLTGTKRELRQKIQRRWIIYRWSRPIFQRGRQWLATKGSYSWANRSRHPQAIDCAPRCWATLEVKTVPWQISIHPA